MLHRSGCEAGQPAGAGTGQPRARTVLLALIVLALLAGAAQAQSWTVQTVAFRDLRDAKAAATKLTQLGLDAYNEYSMSRGLQYVRVRVGCFLDRDSAEAAASALKGRVTAEAVVVPLTRGAPVTGCVRAEVGFLKPSRWRVEHNAAGIPTFDVEVAGQSAHIVHTGLRWSLVQQGDPMPDLSGLPIAVFGQGSLAGQPVVMETLAGRRLMLCPGRLLATVGNVALVEQATAVVACRFDVGAPNRAGTAP